MIKMKPVQHIGKVGTLDGYSNHGCRCEECTRRWREYMAKRRSERRQGPIPDDIHGKYTTYANWGCRCPACTKATTKAKRAQGKQRLAEGLIEHGSPYAYNIGCRCELCREAKRVRGLRSRVPKQIERAHRQIAKWEAFLEQL